MRRALGILFSTLVATLALAGFALPASAEVGDRVTRMAIDYTVTADGVLQVTETIDYHFGDTDRHGIYRDLVIREPFADDKSKDQRYDVSNVKVSSPTAPDSFETATMEMNGRRDRVLRIKIGSSSETVPGWDATYKISYEVRGALRHFDDHSELFWDATGSAWDASLDRADVTVTVPQGVQRVNCFVGPPGSTDSCESKTISSGKAVFGQEVDVVRGEQLTIVAAIKAGAVRNDTPIVVDPPGLLERFRLNVPMIVAAGLVSLALIVATQLHTKRGGRDLRYAGMPPGTVPPEGIAVQTEKDKLDEEQLPVAFSPPRISPAEGGLLVDAKADTTEIAATLIDLAVRGAIRIENDDDERTAVLVEADGATAPHEQRLLRGLFPTLKPGAVARLETPAVGDHSMVRAAESTVDALREQVEERQWYVRMPRRSRVVPSSGDWRTALGCLVFLALLSCLVGLIIWIVKFGVPSWLGPAVVIAVPALLLINLAIDWFRKRSAGRRTSTGRAIADQVIGFRKYLATAEADQLRFENGEDIFSRYLPWAIVFDLADHWQKLCRQLVDAGRLIPDPTWYTGPSYYTSTWTAANVITTVATTFSPPPTQSTGGGTSSGFTSSSSSSSSGGGGGGGGGGSW
ncbi:DUF2207 domain-containing protein [Kribbella capetownensis]|uniref:DUF2207 domain-containing protein n=1 Tax=Kribbella capetownensis TaxID=1572659 RepID=A0A4R0JQV1_9ACTN|nr:DUF2207 domain-containing protein [Kribbella capetownensis]TCC47416.1 DUF2207 domain-containing protein [Kribbella capetownensis]